MPFISLGRNPVSNPQRTTINQVLHEVDSIHFIKFHQISSTFKKAYTNSSRSVKDGLAEGLDILYQGVETRHIPVVGYTTAAVDVGQARVERRGQQEVP